MLDGLRAQTRPVDRVVAVDTGSRDGSADLLADGLRRDASVPSARATTPFPRPSPRPGRSCPTGGRREWVWLLHDDAAPPRRPRASCSPPPRPHPDAASSGPSCASGPRCGACSSSASPSPAPAAARPAWSAASTTRASTTRSARCSPSTPPGMLVRREVLERARRVRPPAAALRQRHRLRLAGRARRPPHARGPAGGGLPRRGGPPRRAPHPADRPRTRTTRSARAALYTLLANATGRSAAVAGRAAVLRLAAPDARLPAGALARRGADELVALVASTPGPAGSSRRAGPAPGRRAATARRTPPAGPAVAALPPRPRPRHRPRRRRDQPGRGRRRAPPRRPRHGSGEAEAAGFARRQHSHAGRLSRLSDDEDEAIAPDAGLLVRIVHQPAWRLASILFVLVALTPPARRSARWPAARLSPDFVPGASADWWGLYAEHWHAPGPRV